MLTLSDLRQPTLKLPGIYCLWLSPSVVNLVTLHSAMRLKPHRAGQNPSWCWGCCFPSSCCCLEGSGLPEQDECCHMGDDSALRPGSYSLSSHPKASVPSISSRVSSPFCTPLPGIYCLWLSPSVVNLVTLHSAVSLSTTELGQSLSRGQDCSFP